MINRKIIACPKGRLLPEIADTFHRELGTNAFPMSSRQYYFPDFFDEGVDLFIAKPKAIPQLLESGLCQYGFCGHDIMLESMVHTTELCDLGTNKINIVLAMVDGVEDFPKHFPTICATEFPNIASQWFIERGIPHYILHTGGGTEGYPYIGAHCIVDIVETGRTLIENKLTTRDTLTTSSTRFYCGENVTDHPEIVKKLISKFNNKE